MNIYTLGTNMQCWGKLLLKVMHYNIALLPKKADESHAIVNVRLRSLSAIYGFVY